MPLSFTRTLKLKVRTESYGWLNAAAIEVNQVFNYVNEASWLAATRTDLKRKWLTGFDLCNLTSGAARYFERIGADTIQRVCTEYAQKRVAAKRRKLRWRVSRGARRSLGWVPMKAASLKRKGKALRFCGKTFRVFESHRLEGVKWRQGCFAQDAIGDWWLCLPVDYTAEPSVAPEESVGIDLGLKETAVTSEGERLECGRCKTLGMPGLWNRARPRSELGAKHSLCRAEEASLRLRERVIARHHSPRARHLRLRERGIRMVACGGMSTGEPGSIAPKPPSPTTTKSTCSHPPSPT